MPLDANGRPSQQKATLGQALAAGADEILFYCVATVPVSPVTCRHHASVPIAIAIAKWGAGRMLGEVPVKCSKCGGRYVDVRPHYPYRGPAGFKPGH